MIVSFLYIILAALGLGFLVFIHELGHYWMARRVGMRVEAFGIGFGKPIYSWKKDGVEWRLCWLPFGGYVKIAGMEAEDGVDPYTIPDGYFGKKPIDRIKVAVMGPLVNLVFALLVFALLWAIGGREKNFGEFTSVIGTVDPKSELYALGVRPGDQITSYNDQPFHSYKDHLYAPMTASLVKVSGLKASYDNKEKVPFEYTVQVYPHPAALDKDLKTTGVLGAASYVIYNKLQGAENPLPEGSPLIGSGIQYGDRILSFDGEIVYSDQQLSELLNEQKALLTVKRGDKTLLKRVPRVPVDELKLDATVKDEIGDWQYAAQLNSVRMQKLMMIPYNLTADGVVEGTLKFIDADKQDVIFPKISFSKLEEALEPGDRIIAVDGTPIKHAYQLLFQLQERQVNIVVERDASIQNKVPSADADKGFNTEINFQDLEKINQSIGGEPISSIGNLVLLKPIKPKMRSEFSLSDEAQARFAVDLKEKKKEIEKIEDSEKRAQALSLLEMREKQLILGLPAYQDRRVQYNPTPTEMFGNVFSEIWNTLSALVSGYLNPKWISGPIGIVQVVHSSWLVSVKDALFWIGAISLNLGILNLLPIPVLDGGYICLSLFEMITRQRLKPKTIEKLIIPFAILMIGLLLFLTYNDLSRILGSFLG